MSTLDEMTIGILNGDVYTFTTEMPAVLLPSAVENVQTQKALVQGTPKCLLTGWMG
jgi:hypothetical protein